MANRLMRNTLGATYLGISVTLAAPAAYAVADIIETPARDTELAPESLLTDATRAGDRIVAVGERGHIIYSDNEGASWNQGEVPVSVTLTGVSFAGPTHGWAVGHSGVILHTDNSGADWELQLDGVQAAELAIAAKERQAEAMEERIEEAPEEEKGDLEWALDDILFTLENLQSDLDVGPVNPLLDVWFGSLDHGIAVGAYGMVLQTHDGGQSWNYIATELDNPQGFHLNGITEVTGGALVIVGESGQIHVSEDGGDTWELRESPYTGSFFGAMGTGQENEILVYGLRGNLLLSRDLGESWRALTHAADATLNSGAVFGDEQMVLVGNGGVVLTSPDGGETFQEHFRNDREGIMNVIPTDDNKLLIFGEGGVKTTDARGRSLKSYE